MKYEFHYKTSDYSYIGGELEGTAEEAVTAYKELERAYRGGKGMGITDFAKIVHEYCTTGAIVDGGNTDFSANEKALLGELKKLIRAKNN